MSSVIRGIFAWAAAGAGVAYFVLAAVEEELAFHFGGDRVALAASQVTLKPQTLPLEDYPSFAHEAKLRRSSNSMCVVSKVFWCAMQSLVSPFGTQSGFEY